MSKKGGRRVCWKEKGERRRSKGKIVKARNTAQAERAVRTKNANGEGEVYRDTGVRMKLWRRPSRDNEAAHECRNEWVLFTIANSGPSDLAGLHPLAPANTRCVATTANNYEHGRRAVGDLERERERGREKRAPSSRSPVYPDF